MKRVLNSFSMSLMVASIALGFSEQASSTVIDVSASLPASPASSSGFNIVQETFTLPPDFLNAVLNIDTFAADDRATLSLNGSIVASSGMFGPGLGSMVLTEGGENVPFLFDYSSFGPFSPVVSGFIAGLNTLQITVNNTNAGIFGDLTIRSEADPSSLAFSGSVSFESGPAHIIPLPATLPLLLLGLAGLSFIFRARRIGA